MQPSVWQPPVEPSPAEQAILKRIRRAKLFVFLRRIRHQLFDAAFQSELAGIYKDSPCGQPPIPPAQLALATVLQAYTGISDDETIEVLTMDRRWQMVLDCLDCEEAPFGKATLIRFRQALIAHGLDRRLIERTIELATSDGGFGSRALRAALDSSPLWGAGRVEDSFNLLGHAMRKALRIMVCQTGVGLAQWAEQTGTTLVAGSSLKAALDIDWSQPDECAEALGRLLGALESLESYLDGQTQPPQAGVARCLQAAEQVHQQDVQLNSRGQFVLRRGVSRERRISIEDPAMRHGRKSRAVRIDGYKRHVLKDIDSGLVRAVGITAANRPEAAVTRDIEADLEPQRVKLIELHIDRAYLSSEWVRLRPEDLRIYCKAWPVRNGPYFQKTAFVLDWEAMRIRCPQGVTQPFEVGGKVRFPAARCRRCPLQERCTTSPKGRSVSIHPDELLLVELRERQQTKEGRAKLRERVSVEHSLAHIGQWQGRRARYLGVRKNLFDLRRVAVVHNLHVLARQEAAGRSQAA
ncbi:IS1182-like element ISGvi6 family transposase [Gloeobacter violaceus]|uniref:Gll0151 protein n=1 Tax=Gloeobacter violaceus (strain ATCC 29082 / PCC 7421) TaxID=251221 RepID=Q7M793_GLOVI|nr:IS1182-like element ISGvi6 family transposase [Gloeobacter violaceus]BAC88092.1 gll0151 [Gloeobacter violaceus PCC 7421]BAC88547.1 gll0606 [Gloeobacter violaceus PCC 7421]BAC90925.1 gll2984 [Gloeobacter violaceus PCC 7421]BAC91777.1 gll3836 [Gloeobacter violaceus PCC 7421]BAC92263.1 glr4322 [Gloeobacter violaceus PCC 7421]